MSFKTPSRRLQLQTLEGRCLLAGWQNPENRFDANSDGDVTALDALVIINGLAANQSTEAGVPLGDRQPDSIEPWGDVNGDGRITAVDALQVINAIARNPNNPVIVASLTSESDPNGNGTVLKPTVTVRGQTSPHATVSIVVDNIGLQQNVLASRFIPLTVDANDRGEFEINVELFTGRNRLIYTVHDELGREADEKRDVVYGDLATDWNAAILNVVRDWSTTSDDPFVGRLVPSPPPVVAYNLALIQTAIFDSLASIQGGYATYLIHDSALADTSALAAAGSAAFEVASKLYPQAREMAVWQSSLFESLQGEPNLEARQRGIDHGAAIAARILQSREGDGSTSVSNYTPQASPGNWNRTAPNFLPPVLPHWGKVTPLAATDISSFRPAPPPSLDSADYARDVDEVMRLGRIDSTLRSSEQTAIARFWIDGAGTATPPGHWNRIAAEVGLSQQQTLLQNARTLALLNLALADAGIASWDAKYQYDLWRPIDAIRQADIDGNSATIADPNWLPLIVTPPFPAYTSGHSTFSGAAATVLTHLFGEQVAFASRSDGHSGLLQKPLEATQVRHFANFHEAAAEAGESRIFGGIHYRFDSVAGLSSGSAVAQFIVDRWLPLLMV